MKKVIIILVLFLFTISGLISCGGGGKSSWETGDYSAIPIELDMDAVREAFQEAKDPQDFEEKVNQIYTGDELISLFVESPKNGNQAVTLYFDTEPVDGKFEESKDTKIAKLARTDVDTANKRVQYETTGYGPYAHYSHPPMYYSFASGLATYWLLSRVFYPRPYYYTPMSRYSSIRTSRANYRKTPAYKTRQQKSRSLTKSFNSNPKTKSLRSNLSKTNWAQKSKSSGSFGSGTKSASSSKHSSSSGSSKSSSSRSSSPSSSSRSFSGSRSSSSSSRSSSRSFGGSRRRR